MACCACHLGQRFLNDCYKCGFGYGLDHRCGYGCASNRGAPRKSTHLGKIKLREDDDHMITTIDLGTFFLKL